MPLNASFPFELTDEEDNHRYMTLFGGYTTLNIRKTDICTPNEDICIG